MSNKGKRDLRRDAKRPKPPSGPGNHRKTGRRKAEKNRALMLRFVR